MNGPRRGRSRGRRGSGWRRRRRRAWSKSGRRRRWSGSGRRCGCNGSGRRREWRNSSRRRRRGSGLSAHWRNRGGDGRRWRHGRRRRRRGSRHRLSRGRRRNDCRLCSPPHRRRRLRRPQIVFATRRERPIDLRLDEHVVRPADHDEMLYVISPDEDELPLAVETERVDEAQPRLPGPAARDPQPVREHQTINDRQCHQNGDPASYQNADLGNRVAAKRKVIQPLHAISNTHAADRADDNLALRHGRRAQHVVNTSRRIPQLRRIGAMPIAAQNKPSRLHNKTQSR